MSINREPVPTMELAPRNKKGTRIHEATVHLVTTLKNKQTGKYAGKIEMDYGSGHDESMDNIPPVNPRTGEEETILQPPLPGTGK